MKHHKLLFQLALVMCISLFCARAHADEVEVQLGAFTIEAIARECINEYQHLERDVFIKKIQNSAGKSFYTVRTGPFESVEKARSFVEKLSPSPDDKPWIMQADSMRPAARPEGTDVSAAAPFAAAAEEAETDKPEKSASPEKTAENRQDQNTAEESAAQPAAEAENQDESEAGLWGAAESGDEADATEADGQPAKDAAGAAEQPAADAGAQTDTGPPASQDEAPASVKELQKEVKSLKEKVQTLLDAQEVRKELEATEEEQEEEEEDILSAAGRQYTLLQKGRLGVEYKFNYTYFAYDALREQNIIEHNSEHTIRNLFTVEYPIKDNLTMEAVLQYVYKYDKVGSDQSRDVTDLGDADFAVNYQPFKSGPKLPSIIFRGVLTCPLGRDPYDINPDTELSTGSGGYALQGSMSVSKAVDPIMVFGSLGYTYKHPIDDLDYKLDAGTTLEKYERGDSVNFSMGIGYSLSYITSLTLSYSYSYSFEDERFFKEGGSQTYQTRTDSSLSLGTSWRLSQKMRMNMSLGIGLANNDYFTLAFRFPYEFDL